jgi:chromosome partitioning protein
MAVVIAIVSQKGGVGKSVMARLIAQSYAGAGWNVKIADLDTYQGSTYDWHTRRLQNQIQPDVAVERFRTMEQALKTGSHYDLLVIDGKPHSSGETLKMVQPATVAILPTGVSIDDRKPQVLLAHELTEKGIPTKQIAFALCRVGDNEAELSEARDYITQAGYKVLAGDLPERTAYRRANEEGRAFTETRFPALNERAATLAQSIVNAVTKIEKGAAA